ncbi:MAG: Imm49 family immunity protein [Acetobacteraceae bacterium]|jgi:hypothetical protein
MLELNQIAELRAQQSAAFTRELLADVLNEPAQSSLDASAGRLSLDLALLLYALESDRTEIRQCFRQAALHLSRDLAARQPPDPATHRSPCEAEMHINVIASFGTQDDRGRIAGLQPWQYRNPPYPEHAALARYLAALLPYVSGAPLDHAALDAVAAACETDNATKEDRLFLLPSVRGLAAVEARDARAWNLALAQRVAAHQDEARAGDVRLLPQGFICLGGMMLAKLGRDKGMACRATSDYLPLFLLDDEAPG